MRIAMAATLATVLFAFTSPAWADSGSITNVSPIGSDQLQATFTSTVDHCDPYGYCGWFPFATEELPSTPCYGNSPNVIYVAPVQGDLGTVSDTTVFFTDALPQKLCLFVDTPEGTDEELAEYVVNGAAPPPPVTTPTTPVSTPGPATLSKGEALSDMRWVLQHKFRRAYAHRADFHGSCGRLSQSEFRCKVRWLQISRCRSCGRAGFKADASYKGTITVSNPSNPAATYFLYSYRIKRTRLASGRNHVYSAAASALAAAHATLVARLNH